MRLFYVFLVMGTLSALVLSPALNGEFIMDDWGYITQNASVIQASSPLKYWTTFETTDFWPLTYTLYWLEYQAFGQNPLGYHIVNIVLHALNGFLLYLLALELGLSWALFASLLFLLHPLHVQGAAWIAQSKTLLSTMFVLLTLLFYFRGKKTRAAYAFAVSLLAKTSGLFLPFIFLFLERGKKRREQLQLYPFFALSLVFGFITLRVNDLHFKDTNFPIFQMPWYERLLIVPQNLVFYLKSFVIPYPLAYLYTPPGVVVWAWLVILLGCLCWLRHRFVLFYLILLLPCLGLVTIPNMKLSLVSDHWAYLPNLFLCLFAAVLLERIQNLKLSKAVGAVALGICAILSAQHAKTFATEESFWRQAVLVNPNSAPAAYNLGVALDKKQQIPQASAEYKRTVELDPKHARAWNNLARTYFILKDLPAAQSAFEGAIAANPQLIVAYLGLAKVHMVLLGKDKAEAVLQKGLAANPGDPSIVSAMQNLKAN